MRRTWTIGIGLMLGAAALVGAGCGKEAAGGGPDQAYLTHAPPTDLPQRDGYFPARRGDRWTMRGTVGGKPFAGTVRVIGTRRVGAVSGVLFETSLAGRPLQQEVFEVRPEGVYRLASGPKGGMALVPPMPVLRYPMKSGDSFAWQGTLVKDGRSVKAESFCEVSGPVAVPTEPKPLKAYRLDFVMKTRTPTGEARTRSTLWFAPDVGIVKQEGGEGDRHVALTMTDFQLSPR